MDWFIKLVGNLMEGDHLENPGIDGRIILKEVGWGMNWIDLVQDSDKWRALVCVVMYLRVPYNKGNFLIR
jgi:hypothetical protein